MPMPPPMAFWMLFGMERMMLLRNFVTVIRMLMTPQMNTMASACCHLKPSEKHTV